jgi:hypothetical protein
MSRQTKTEIGFRFIHGPYTVSFAWICSYALARMKLPTLKGNSPFIAIARMLNIPTPRMAIRLSYLGNGLPLALLVKNNARQIIFVPLKSDTVRMALQRTQAGPQVLECCVGWSWKVPGPNGIEARFKH